MSQAHEPGRLAPLPTQPTRQEIHKLLKRHDRSFTRKRIGEMIDVDVGRGCVSQTLRKMKRDGLVQVEKHPSDGRKYIYSATEKIRDVPHYSAHPVNHYFNNGYSIITHHHKSEEYRVAVHRLVAVAEYGIEAVKEKDIHHKNKTGIDNRPSNLIPVDPSLHKKMDIMTTLRLSCSDKEFSKIVEMAEGVIDETAAE